MKKYFGYILSGVLFIAFITLSIILKFRTGNTVWAAVWMTAMVITAFIQTIINLRNKAIRDKKNYIIALILLSICIIATIAIAVAAILGVPEAQFPLY